MSDCRQATKRCIVAYCMLALCHVFVLSRCTVAQTQIEQTNPVESSPDTLVVVVGAAGAGEFLDEFESSGKAWQELGAKNEWNTVVIYESNAAARSPYQQLQASIAAHEGKSSRLWIVLLGHGTFTNGIAKFNLVGPDVSVAELKNWLLPITSQVVLINCSSASAPFLPELSGEGRITITATRSGSEINYSRFGKYLSESILDLEADIDHDESVSLLEAFLAASAKTEKFYRDEARLASEHALIDDNHDRVGTSADFYVGIRPAKSGKDNQQLDGANAARVILYESPSVARFSPELDAQRIALELSIEKLRAQKSSMEVDAYFDQLEQLMLQLAKLYDAAEAKN